MDVAYLNLAGTFYYLCSVLDGCSRFIVHWASRATMKEEEIEQIVQRGREQFPGVTPRIIADNGPQFVAKDFKEFIRLCGMTHVKTSPYYPQSNGKIERFHRTIEGDGIRTETPLSLEDAQRVVARYVEHYNTVRLHSAIGYVTAQAKLDGRAQAILAERDRIVVLDHQPRCVSGFTTLPRAPRNSPRNLARSGAEACVPPQGAPSFHQLAKARPPRPSRRGRMG